jgi:hypothetical protein
MMPLHLEIEDVLFVATDLSVLNQAATPATLQDIDIEGRVYRPLDPEYYAWLRTRMERAQVTFERGRLSPQAYELFRIRFNALHDQAVALFGEDPLLDAVVSLDPKSYAWPGRASEIPQEPTPAKTSDPGQPAPQVSPTPEKKPQSPPSLDGWSKHSFPEEEPERFRFCQRVSNHALAQVNAIRDEAQGKGWTEAELYQTRGRFPFPCGRQYGLVCFIHRDQRVGKVTANNIEIVYPDGHALRFYRNEVTT